MTATPQNNRFFVRKLWVRDCVVGGIDDAKAEEAWRRLSDALDHGLERAIAPPLKRVTGIWRPEPRED